MLSTDRLIGIFILLAMVGPSAGGEVVDPDGVTFFEQKIRPVLVKECYSCHSAEAKAIKGGFRLDSRDGLLAGGDSGPAVVPGKPEESPLLDALRHDGIAMPPKSKLPDPVVADFERWIKMGLPDPRSAPTQQAQLKKAGGLSLEEGRKFWSYKPPQENPLPAVKDRTWPRNEIDHYLLARIEERGLRPVGDADKATLIRRLYFDLIGLPPSPEEVDAFVADPSALAYDTLVDRLLASPQFGERWGRHWLDVVRYAESMTLRGLIFKQAWRFRDHVIDAFNNDMPFDQMIREQIAGDLLPSVDLEDRRQKLVATTFLTLGNTNLEEQDKPQLDMDVVDEQIDTIGKAFLGQTIGCARCHDHKFDPIPTRDYYAMAGILRNTKTLAHANVSNWLEQPLPVVAEQERILKEHDLQVTAIEAEIKTARGKLGLGKNKGKGNQTVIAVRDAPGIVVDDAEAKRVGEWKESQFSNSYIGAGYLHDLDAGKGEKSLTFLPDLKRAGTYEVWLAYAPGASRSKTVPIAILSADGDEMLSVDMSATPPIDGRYLSLGRFKFESNGQGYVMISNEGTTGHVTADAVLFIPTDGGGQLSTAKSGGTVDEARRANEAAVHKLERKLKKLKEEGPTKELFMGVQEAPEIAEIRVHVRGSVHTLGEPAPRGVLTVATYGELPTMPSDQSGRRELADWLADERNPLTARVYVNRVWHWLFGAGLVRTTDNFGTTGEAPSHPELLDHLALQFMRERWSVKTLIRGIVRSRAYQLASTDDPESRALDPENRLLWKMNRRRLDAECIRDTILSVSGTLDPQMKGLSFPPELAADYGYVHDVTRRSVYSPVFRNALPELFEAFDFADPSMVVGRRNISTVAPQALFLMNHPFVIERSREAADRLLANAKLDDAGRLERVYELTLGRHPTEKEQRIGLAFVARNQSEGKSAARESWALLFQAVFSSVDFRYVN